MQAFASGPVTALACVSLYLEHYTTLLLHLLQHTTTIIVIAAHHPVIVPSRVNINCKHSQRGRFTPRVSLRKEIGADDNSKNSFCSGNR